MSRPATRRLLGAVKKLHGKKSLLNKVVVGGGGGMLWAWWWGVMVVERDVMGMVEWGIMRVVVGGMMGYNGNGCGGGGGGEGGGQ